MSKAEVGAVGAQAVTLAQEISHRVARAAHIDPVRDPQRHAADRGRVASQKTQYALARGRERDDHLIVEIITAQAVPLLLQHADYHE